MTHFGGHTYLQRGVEKLLILFVILERIWRIDRFHTFHLNNFKQLKSHTLAAAFLLFSVILSVIQTLIVAGAKYDEGLYCTDQDVPLPKALDSYSTTNRNAIIVMNHLLNFVMNFKTSGSFLLLASWGWIGRITCKGRSDISFQSSAEFKIFVVSTVVSTILYPVFSVAFKYNITLSVIMAQFIYIVELIIIGVLCIIMKNRFQDLVNDMKLSAEKMQHRMIYYIQMNKVWAVCSFTEAFTLLSLNIDSAFCAANDCSDSTKFRQATFWFDVIVTIFTISNIGGYVVSFWILFVERSNIGSHITSDPSTEIEMGHTSSLGNAPSSRLRVIGDTQSTISHT